jgi:hypothetical protein
MNVDKKHFENITLQFYIFLRIKTIIFVESLQV